MLCWIQVLMSIMFLFDLEMLGSFKPNEHDILDPHWKSFPTIYILSISGIFSWSSSMYTVGEDGGKHRAPPPSNYLGFAYQTQRFIHTLWTLCAFVRFLAIAFWNFTWILFSLARASSNLCLCIFDFAYFIISWP